MTDQSPDLAKPSRKDIQIKPVFQIMPISEQDLDQIIDLASKTPEFQTGTDSAQFYRKETLSRWISHPDGVTLIAKIDGQIAGFILGSYIPGPNDGYLNCLVVDPKYQRSGIGKFLITGAIMSFEGKSWKGNVCNHLFGVVEEGNDTTLKFFERHGIRRGKKFYYIDTMLPRKEE